MEKVNENILIQSGLLSGLVTQTQVDQAIDAIRQAGKQLGDDTLADHFVKSGVLTSYQSQQLRAGRTKLTLGPYLITDFIGQGGMGQVFKAEHQMMGREVAIKVLPKSKSSTDSIANFTREIRTQAQLDHRNLVRAYDAGHDGNVYFLVTEYIEGTDLRGLVRVEGKLSMQLAASIVMQAALGLDYAHQRTLIHRDVKPANLLVTTDGTTKVSDLGLAGFLHEGDADPRAGKIVGTADYLSPEQIKSPRDVTPISDIYSLGCTLYYAVTSKVPFPGGSIRDKARRHCEDTPWHPRRFNNDISDEFVDIIADMMEKDPRKRINSCAEVAARLEPWASDAEPLSSSHLTKSPWLPPPVPSGKEDTTEFEDPLYPNSNDENSQGTESIDIAVVDTEVHQPSYVVPVPPPITPRRRTRRKSRVWLALLIAIPISIALGSIATWLVLSNLKP